MALNESERADLRAILTARREALAEEIRRDVERLRTDTMVALSGPVRDSADEAVSDLIAETGSAETTRDIVEFRAIEAALVRLTEGTYGVCEDCVTDLAYERLRAAPAAVRCVACQEKYEKSAARAPRASL